MGDCCIWLRCVSIVGRVTDWSVKVGQGGGQAVSNVEFICTKFALPNRQTASSGVGGGSIPMFRRRRCNRYDGVACGGSGDDRDIANRGYKRIFVNSMQKTC